MVQERCNNMEIHFSYLPGGCPVDVCDLGAESFFGYMSPYTMVGFDLGTAQPLMTFSIALVLFQQECGAFLKVVEK